MKKRRREMKRRSAMDEPNEWNEREMNESEMNDPFFASSFFSFICTL